MKEPKSKLKKMLSQEELNQIRSAHAGGEKIKAIARRTGHARNTIRSAVRTSGPPQYGGPERS
jgi:hypothetical protein